MLGPQGKVFLKGIWGREGGDRTCSLTHCTPRWDFFWGDYEDGEGRDRAFSLTHRNRVWEHPHAQGDSLGALGQVHLGKHIKWCSSLNVVRSSLRVARKKKISNLNKVSRYDNFTSDQKGVEFSRKWCSKHIQQIRSPTFIPNTREARLFLLCWDLTS